MCDRDNEALSSVGPTEFEGIDELELGIVEDILKEALQAEINMPDYHPTKQNFNVKQFARVVEQYVSPFLVLGYDVNGKNVAYINCEGDKDLDAIYMLINRFVNNPVVIRKSGDIEFDGSET